MNNKITSPNTIEGGSYDTNKLNRVSEVRNIMKTLGQVIAGDAEWDEKVSNKWICSSFAGRDRSLIVFRHDVPESIKVRLRAEAFRLGVDIFFIKRTDKTNFMKGCGKVKFLLYFSPKDVEYAVGWRDFSEALKLKLIRQKNNLSGHIKNVYLKDIIGWAGKASLKKFASAMGVPMLNKSSMDTYKKCMWTGLMEEPEKFLEYALDDAKVLLNISNSFVSKIRDIQHIELGIPESDCWTLDDIPMTSGALVAKTFERWLYHFAGKDRELFKLSLRKLGILDMDDKNYMMSREATRRLWDYPEIGSEWVERVMKAKFKFTGLDAGGVRMFAGKSENETACFNALMQGGRALNEMPREYFCDEGLDIDLKSCYGTTLRNCFYPIGLPTIWNYTSNQTRQTFGNWLHLNESELVDGMWMLLVSGRIGFEQDLIFSKIVEARNIKKAVRTDENPDIPADFVMLRKQVVNGVITSDVLKTLKAVASNQEWKDILALEVVAGAGYLNSDRASSISEWCLSVMQDSGKLEIKNKSSDTTDDRTRCWYGVSLENFIGRLVDLRNGYKKDASGMDAVLKLLINTLYGVLAAPYFSVGNTIVANNITARARVGVWMMAKALQLRQSITDGGIYTPYRIPSFCNKKPCLETLARMYIEWEGRDRGYTFLDDRLWKRWSCSEIDSMVRDYEHIDISPPDLSGVDSLALQHIQGFWSPYGLTFPFDIEHKKDNAFLRAGWWMKADYALLTYNKKIIYMVRGKDKGKKSHPTFTLMDNILLNNDVFPTELDFKMSGILKVGSYRLATNGSAGYAHLKGLRPGDNIPERSFIARYNNTFMPMMDVDDYNRRRNRKKISRGLDIEWFERFREDGIGKVHQKMRLNTLR